MRSGRFASPDEAITAAVPLLRKQEEAEEARVLEGIRQGLEDMRAGRGRPAEEVFADIRRSSTFPQTHDLPHCRRAYGRAGDSVRRSLEDRKRFPRRRGTVVQRPGQENRHAPPP